MFIPSGFALCAFRYRLTGDPEVMVTTIGIAVGADPQADANAMADAHTARLAAIHIASGWEYLGVHLKVGQDLTPPLLVEANRNVVGTGAAHTVPNNCAYLLRKLTATGGRSGRGRMYIPPFYGAEVDVDKTGLMSATMRTNLEADWRDILDTRPVYLFHKDAGPVSVGPYPITALNLDQRIATQRRRMRR